MTTTTPPTGRPRGTLRAWYEKIRPSRPVQPGERAAAGGVDITQPIIVGRGQDDPTRPIRLGGEDETVPIELRAGASMPEMIRAGEGYLARQEYGPAHQLFLQVLGRHKKGETLEPRALIAASHGYAASLAGKGDLGKAVVVLEYVINLEPGNPNHYFDLIRLFCSVNRPDLAKNALDLAHGNLPEEVFEVLRTTIERRSDLRSLWPMLPPATRRC